jgi:hypothetical protein
MAPAGEMGKLTRVFVGRDSALKMPYFTLVVISTFLVFVLAKMTRHPPLATMQLKSVRRLARSQHIDRKFGVMSW